MLNYLFWVPCNGNPFNLKNIMIPLKKHFKRGNREFLQLYRDNKLALYQITMTLPDGVVQFAEIFRVRVHQPDPYHYNESYEMYPGDESFGEWAWCCSTLPSLEKILTMKFDVDIASLQVDLSFLPWCYGDECDEML